tara:strand:- start:432 stop:887 length:456 start_codon:yes stop_codon:yes gene_type:complete
MIDYLNRWEFYSIVALMFFLFSITIRKFVFNNKYKYCDYIFFYSFATFVISFIAMIFIYCMYKNELFKEKVSNKTYLVFASSILVFIGILFKIKGYELVPNVAVLDGFMEPLKVISLFAISYLFLSTGLNLKVLSGIILSAIGVIVIIKHQ